MLQRILWFIGFLSFASFASGQSEDFPVRSWTVPPYALSGGMTTMTDATPPRVFIGVQPCRLVDTRAGSGFPSAFGAPGLSAGVPRSFDLNNGPCPGLPFTIDAYSLNVTVTNTAGPGHLVVYPQGGAQPTVSSINYIAGETVANAVIVPAGTDGGITVVAAAATNLLIDINGYFASFPGDAAASLVLVNTNTGSPTGSFRNSSSGCQISGCALRGSSDTNAFGSAVAGLAAFGGGNTAGVFGSQGIPTLTGRFTGAPGYSGAGVLGHSPTNGVLGISTFQGVTGSLISGGTELAWGVIGFAAGTDPGGGSPPWGLFSGGSIGAVGTKHFLDPHPTDPSRAIAYVSLEGPEAGTYFRGRSRFQNGTARIPVPEHFRLVTDAEGLTVQITPIGAMATYAVLRADLNEILVQASRNVEFYYVVQGVRSTYRDVSPFRSAAEFMPRSADAKIPEWLSPAQRRLLIQNGTYREDGTVNLETAERLGWDDAWAKRDSRPSPAPAPE